MVADGAADDQRAVTAAHLRTSRLTVEWWLIAIIATLTLLFLIHDRTTQRLDSVLYDLVLQRGKKLPDPRILIVAIDDQSVREIGAWPWPRQVQAALIRRIGEGRPTAVGYDVLLVDPRPGDDRLGAAVAAAKSVYVPLMMQAPGANGANTDVILPVPAVRHAAAGIGHVNLAVDPDGKLRRAELNASAAGHSWPHLMVLLSRAANPQARPFNDTTAPVLIPFSGGVGAFPTIGASAVLRGEIPANLIQNRLVLVGATAEGLGDRYATGGGNPGEIVPGVEVQAQLLDALLSNRIIIPAKSIALALFSLAPVWILLIALRLLRPSMVVIAFVMLAAATGAAAIGALLALHLWITPVPAFVGLALIYPLWGWRRLAAASAYMAGELERFQLEPKPLAVTGTPASAGDPIGRQIAMLDDAIMHSRDLRRFVSDSLDQIPDGIIVTDLEGTVLLSNPEGDHIFETCAIAPEMRTAPRLFDQVKPNTPGSVAYLRDGGRPSWPPPNEPVQYQAVPFAGRRFDLRVAPRKAFGGELLGWIVRLTDVTEFWHLQREREDMVEFVSHDMRSPLVSILALLSSARGRGINAELAERIDNYARRTISLADGLVQLARAEALQYRPEPVNLSDVLLDALDQIWPGIVAEQLQLELKGEDEEFVVLGERSLLTRAVTNLLDNAVRHSPAGTRLTCSLSIAWENDAPFGMCSIADEGSGVPSELRPLLFDRFQQGDENKNAGGAGLGLSLVRVVARRHLGWVRYEDGAEGGAIFNFAIPLISADPMVDREE
jgi:CHASE2 domain-containing sensor protein/signal transduction histidine kinase